ncbi:MAG: nucleoside monophosphate kinase [Candidatus Magasanikbacteria bacterium]|nr:nucleoside monophosphate kinase [Candidatus Magasanikbacteria bacterium]
MKKIIILLGAPGSGKGTQSRILVDMFGYGHISTGDLLRALDKNPQADPEEKKELEAMKRGSLVADELIYKLAFRAIGFYVDQGNGVVLDGAIRSVEQAKRYQAFFEEKKMGDQVLVIELKISDETSFKRLTKRKICESCGFILPYSPENEQKKSCPECGASLVVRHDDSPESVQRRILEQGNTAIAPIAAYYQALGVLHVLDGEEAITDVDQVILDVLRRVS